MFRLDKKIAIFGAGGFGQEALCCLIDCLANTHVDYRDVAAFIIDDAYATDSTIKEVPVIPFSQFNPLTHSVIVAVGDPLSRKAVVERFPKETTYATLIHPTAVVSKWVDIGAGSIITAGTIVTCNIKMGKHSHLNLHTTIGHDCIMGDYFTTAPAANISGHCHFEECVYVGTNVSVKQGISICSNVTVGMGAVVVKNITEGGVYIGNPLKKLEKPV
jgi:sugar O-acyltransferase (sialic acid O-acetyltransferase NeuD family)